jgi:CRP-like cAMP-binding protein
VPQPIPNPPYFELWQALGKLQSVCTYEEGMSVFQQGCPARGIYLVEKGEVRLILQAPVKPGRTFAIAGPGALLGLSEAVTGEAHKLSAEAAGEAQIGFVERGPLLAFLRDHHQFCLQIVRLLSDDLHGLYQRFQCMSSEERPAGKPARPA